MDDVLQVSIVDLVVINPGTVHPCTSCHSSYSIVHFQNHCHCDSYYLSHKNVMNLFVLFLQM